jgi:hypothetical protein
MELIKEAESSGNKDRAYMFARRMYIESKQKRRRRDWMCDMANIGIVGIELLNNTDDMVDFVSGQFHFDINNKKHNRVALAKWKSRFRWLLPYYGSWSNIYRKVYVVLEYERKEVKQCKKKKRS